MNFFRIKSKIKGYEHNYLKKIKGIFDLVCVVEGWMNLRFYLRFL
jgi:hypothetical protein